ncbi:MAG: glycosyltransferase, partial [Acidimicrobiales bacterium]
MTESTVRVVGTAAVLWGLMYLAWRLLATGDGTSPLLFWPLLIAEAMGWLGLVLLLTQTWNLPDRSWSRRRPDYTADVIVTSYNDPIADVRTSLLGALSVAGVSEVVLADDGGRNELRELAHRLDVAYVQRGSTEGARAGNINELLPRLSSDLVVLLAAGQAAMPDLLTATDRYFDDPDVAVVVCGSRDASRTRITHSTDDRHEQALDSEVIVPGLDRSGTLPWIEGPAVVRRDAV